MTGVPATPDMHFRSGSVAIAYLGVVTLQLQDKGVLSLDDKLSKWFPDYPKTDFAASRAEFRSLQKITRIPRDLTMALISRSEGRNAASVGTSDPSRGLVGCFTKSDRCKPFAATFDCKNTLNVQSRLPA
jgi:Beta-lactamase